MTTETSTTTSARAGLARDTIRLAVLGCGGRATGVLGLLREIDPAVRVTGVVDPAEERVRSALGDQGFEKDDIRFYADADALLADADAFDGVMIGTRCHLHTPLAVKVAPSGLPVFLEKPVSVTEEQLAELCGAFRGREENVVVSFPLRVTPVFREAVDIIRSGRLGTINQVQAVNNVSYGGCYYGMFYRNWDEVGGLWLQKATHDFDYINRMVDAAPRRVAATNTRRVYGGDMPHELHCAECDRTEACMESPINIERRGDSGGMDWCGEFTEPHDHWCAFSREIKNQDAGSALIMYENGVHANYTQNFVTRRSAGHRGATITGYTGTLKFDFGGNIRVTDHHKNRVDNIEVKATGGHGGGDSVLAKSFIDLIRGEAPSVAPLTEGELSAAMCLAARRSAETGTFQDIVVP